MHYYSQYRAYSQLLSSFFIEHPKHFPTSVGTVTEEENLVSSTDDSTASDTHTHVSPAQQGMISSFYFLGGNTREVTWEVPLLLHAMTIYGHACDS